MVNDWLADGSFEKKLPEVATLKGVQQRAEFHREGDAYAHTLLAMDAVAEHADARVFWGALLHDIGKGTTTLLVEGCWRAHGHDKQGALLVPAIMQRLELPELAEDVQWLVRNHLFHLSWHLKPGDRVSHRQRRFMQHELFSLLLEVCAADAQASWGAPGKGEVLTWLSSLLRDPEQS